MPESPILMPRNIQHICNVGDEEIKSSKVPTCKSPGSWRLSEGASAEQLRSEPAWKDCLKSLGIIQGRVLKIWPIYVNK
jgi:hypothetical protein